MHAAAVALLAGVASPIRDFLALPPDDEVLMAAIVRESVRIREEEHKALLDYHARETAGRTIQGFASVVRSALKSLRPRK